MTIIPTPWVMALVFFTFLILIYLLNRILYKPLLGFMDARDSSIKKDSEGIEGNAADVKALKAEAEVILQNARQEASLIKNKAQENAKQMADAKITQKREELNLKYNEFTAILEEEREELKKILLSKIPLSEESLIAKMAKV